MIIKFYYSVLDYCEISRYPIHVENGIKELGIAEAELAACDYHFNSSYGLDGDWPLTFVLYETEYGEEIGRFLIDREISPSFLARKVK